MRKLDAKSQVETLYTRTLHDSNDGSAAVMITVYL